MSQKRSPGFEKKREEETRDDTAELATKKRSPGFSGKNRGVTPSVAAPGVTHPGDATGNHISHSRVIGGRQAISMETGKIRLSVTL